MLGADGGTGGEVAVVSSPGGTVQNDVAVGGPATLLVAATGGSSVAIADSAGGAGGAAVLHVSPTATSGASGASSAQTSVGNTGATGNATSTATTSGAVPVGRLG